MTGHPAFSKSEISPLYTKCNNPRRPAGKIKHTTTPASTITDVLHGCGVNWNWIRGHGRAKVPEMTRKLGDLSVEGSKNDFQHAAVKENVNITSDGAALQSQAPSIQEKHTERSRTKLKPTFFFFFTEFTTQLKFWQKVKTVSTDTEMLLKHLTKSPQAPRSGTQTTKPLSWLQSHPVTNENWTERYTGDLPLSSHIYSFAPLLHEDSDAALRFVTALFVKE